MDVLCVACFFDPPERCCDVCEVDANPEAEAVFQGLFGCIVILEQVLGEHELGVGGLGGQALHYDDLQARLVWFGLVWFPLHSLARLLRLTSPCRWAPNW